MSSFEPVPEIPVSSSTSSGNYFSINLLLGAGVLGLLFSSVLVFGGYVNGLTEGLMIAAKGQNYRMFQLMSFLLEGKMRTLIGISFGAGMILFLFKTPTGSLIRNADYFIRRQLWLILFGLINGLLFLWTKDLLYLFGIMGVLLFPFVRFSPRALLVASITCSLIFSGKLYWQFSEEKQTHKDYLVVAAIVKKMSADTLLQKNKLKAAGLSPKDTARYKIKTDTLTKKQKGEKSKWENLVTGTKYTPRGDKELVKAAQDTSYSKAWNMLVYNTENWQGPGTYKRMIWDISSMVFLGMALFRFGFFEPGISKSKYWLIGLPALLAGCLLAWLRLFSFSFINLDYGKYVDSHVLPYQFFYPFEMTLMAVGYASLLMLLSGSGFLKKILQAFAIVGEMALSNYILQTLVLMLFFLGFGLGYYARMQQWQLYVFAAELALVNIVFSVFWLKFYHYGPVEWLWRCLVCAAWVPNRKHLTSQEPVNAII